MAATTAFADGEQDQSQPVYQTGAQMVSVAERLTETHPESQKNLEHQVETMIESEIMLDLIARLTTPAPQS